MLFVIVPAMTVQAQTTVQSPVVTTTVQVPPGAVTIKPMDYKFNTEILAASSTKVVKGAPFSAEGVSESLQVLADGNRITRTTTTKMYRDGEGRFRREGAGGGNTAVTPSSYGSFTMFYNSDNISIFDPVAGVRYLLNPTTKTARSFSSKGTLTEGGVYVTSQMTVPMLKKELEAKLATPLPPQPVMVLPGFTGTWGDEGKTEQLGTKSFEGVEAEGTRTVKTIAAGAIGNERPIEIVSERWFSKELDMLVYSRHFDPRFGEQTYRLTNINRSEPDRSLFTVPSDYKVTTESQLKVYTTTPTPAKQQ